MIESHHRSYGSRTTTVRRAGANLVRSALVLALAAALLFTGRVADAPAAGPNCTAQEGQAFIDEARYDKAIQAFTCVIEADPTEAEGYRGRAEAELLLGRYADAMADYGRITAVVEPVHPGALQTILAAYGARLADAPDDVAALTGASFARWADFQYPQAIQVLNHLLDVRPEDPYGTLFRGSSRVLKGVTKAAGLADLDRAIELAPASPDVRWIVADAYTYGLPDPERAFAEASLALEWGLDTPRIHAILGSAYNAFGDQTSAASHIQRHIELVTTELVTSSPLATGASLRLGLVPGRTYEIPVPAVTGETISIATSSKDYWDTIAVLLAPDGTPLVGSDDENAYFADFDWTAEETGSYRLQVTFFESVNTGELLVARN
jgi:tetratricopeptide (TPR) repeat protein